MTKSPGERKAAQHARQAAAGGKKLELSLDSQELEMLAFNCAARRPGREPYDLNEYIALLIRKDAAELTQQIEALGHQQCGKCKEQLPVQSCPCQGEAACWATSGWLKLKLNIDTP
ncbi:hypothetical protein [Pantoea anthophila]|uniref:hypothetical protein n=1 Tax=Pantoea anthophila TaxID=470931 RepID=UPI00278A1A68|nr:hypothetical protein [Pantoea anthophila]MDQ1214547.1 hypothetical protein [Pantoea anthophila]